MDKYLSTFLSTFLSNCKSSSTRTAFRSGCRVRYVERNRAHCVQYGRHRRRLAPVSRPLEVSLHSAQSYGTALHTEHQSAGVIPLRVRRHTGHMKKRTQDHKSCGHACSRAPCRGRGVPLRIVRPGRPCRNERHRSPPCLWHHHDFRRLGKGSASSRLNGSAPSTS